MAQAAPLVIYDGAVTPVATTFNPESISPALSTFTDRSTGIATSFRRISVSNKFGGGTGKSSVNRAKLTVDYPVTSLVNGLPAVAYTLRGSIDIILPENATDAERKNLYAFLLNGLSNTLVRGALRDLDPIY